jgi:hypothetical protein
VDNRLLFSQNFRRYSQEDAMAVILQIIQKLIYLIIFLFTSWIVGFYFFVALSMPRHSTLIILRATSPYFYDGGDRIEYADRWRLVISYFMFILSSPCVAGWLYIIPVAMIVELFTGRIFTWENHLYNLGIILGSLAGIIVFAVLGVWLDPSDGKKSKP